MKKKWIYKEVKKYEIEILILLFLVASAICIGIWMEDVPMKIMATIVLMCFIGVRTYIALEDAETKTVKTNKFVKN